MGWTCSTREKCKLLFKCWSENLKERDHLEDLEVDEKIFEFIKGNRMGGYRVDSSGSG
jgi:hypothetical protein